jgi:Tic22-like family
MTPIVYQQPAQPQKAAPKPFFTPAQVLEKCKNIPVFVITDAIGNPLAAQSPEKKTVIGIFLNKKDGESFLEKMRADNSPIVAKLLVNSVQLSDMVSQMQKNPETLFTFIPNSTAVKDAQSLYAAQGKKPESLRGIPLFIARAEKAGGSPSYLMIRNGNVEQVPIFFTKKDADALIKQYQPQLPGKKLRVDVATLENILALFRTSPDPAVNQLILVPSTEMLAAVPKPTPPDSTTIPPPL